MTKHVFHQALHVGNIRLFHLVQSLIAVGIVQGLHGFITLGGQAGRQVAQNLSGDVFLPGAQALGLQSLVQPAHHLAHERRACGFQRAQGAGTGCAMQVHQNTRALYLLRQCFGLLEQLVEALLRWRHLAGVELECGERQVVGGGWRGGLCGLVVTEEMGLMRHG